MMGLEVKWQKDLLIYGQLFSTIIVAGNVHDIYMYDDNGYITPIDSLNKYLNRTLNEQLGYEKVNFYNRIDGFFTENDGSNISSNRHPMCEEIKQIRESVNDYKTLNATVIDLASLLCSESNSLTDAQIELFASLFLASKESAQINSNDNSTRRNLMVLVVDKINDIPAWFYVNNPNVKTMIIPKPDKKVRAKFLATYYPEINLSETDKKALDEFVALTDNFTLQEVNSIRILAKLKKIELVNIKQAINLYKHGIHEKYWEEKDIENASCYFESRVKGQKNAIRHTVDVLQRAACGLSNVQTSAVGHPKGVLFFAGPTGTGKTELAKAIAEKIFGDENKLIRFDMSEYSQEHSDQRLIGAPPGYIGYEAGGQLTNAVKENPFSILLFDEIEKASPRILDKFLQILDDGRLTDSTGETVYFSECLIIFTSNLGMMSNRSLQYQYEKIDIVKDSYSELERKFKNNITIYFCDEINRRELLNRIGSNIVVFDSIRDENTVREILENKISRIKREIMQLKEIEVIIESSAQEYLYTVVRSAVNPEFGARGIVNCLEINLVNPIARYISENRISEGSKLIIECMQDSLEIREGWR